MRRLKFLVQVVFLGSHEIFSFPKPKFAKDDISADGSDSLDLDDNNDNDMDVDNDGGEDDDGGHIMLSDMLDDEEDAVTDADHDALLKRLGKASASGANNKKRKLADLYQTRNEGSFEVRFLFQNLARFLVTNQKISSCLCSCVVELASMTFWDHWIKHLSQEKS